MNGFAMDVFDLFLFENMMLPFIVFDHMMISCNLIFSVYRFELK